MFGVTQAHLHACVSQVNPLDGFERVLTADFSAFKYFLKVRHLLGNASSQCCCANGYQDRVAWRMIGMYGDELVSLDWLV